jgi:hypothetical protein
VIQNFVGALRQALEIIFEMQMKRSNEKIIRRKISFPAHEIDFFFPSLHLLIFKAFNFSHFLFILNNLKCYRNATFNSTNHL